jgi:hypothetical protein
MITTTQNRPRREKPQTKLLKPRPKVLTIFGKEWTARRGDSHFEIVDPTLTKKYIVSYGDVYLHIVNNPPWSGYKNDPEEAKLHLAAFVRHNKDIYNVSGGPGLRMKWRWCVKYIIDVLLPTS